MKQQSIDLVAVTMDEFKLSEDWIINTAINT